MIDYRLFNKDCRSMVELPDNSIHAVCTSPPYWGLRKYSGEQDLIWGDNHCQHEWISTPTQEAYSGRKRFVHGHEGRGAHCINRENNPECWEQLKQGDFCSLCGAWRGAFGLEPTPEMYIQHSVEILQEVRRVLRKDGVVFWNIGDSYAGSNCGSNDYRPAGASLSKSDMKYQGQKPGLPPGLKPLDLCLIPERLAIALQIDGWWVRSIIIWHKANPMPESVNGWRWEQHRVTQCPQCQSLSSFKKRVCKICGWRKPSNRGETEAWRAETGQQEHDENGGFKSDSFMVDCPGCAKCLPNDGLVLRKGSWRPTDSYEQILMLTKTDSYYCDAEAVREAYTEPLNRWGGPTLRQETGKTSEYKDEILKLSPTSAMRAGNPIRPNENGRNLRNVWSFPTVPYPGAHFAVFPEKLPELCIKAATPEVGVCAKCGAPWARVVEHYKTTSAGQPPPDTPQMGNKNIARAEAKERYYPVRYEVGTNTLGWRPTCSCNCPDKVPATVLDPFAGAGTTLLVAIKLGRNAVGYELSSGYCDMTNQRINNVQIRYS